MSADLVIRGARLVSFDGSRGSAAPVPVDAPPVDVVVADGVIAQIGPAGSASAPAPATPTLEAEDRWLMPGLWDAHVHPSGWAATQHRLDLRTVTSRTECTAAVETWLRDHPGEEVVGAHLWCASWPARPTREDIDHVDVPVTLVSGDTHSGLMNAAALARYGLTAAADDDGWVAENAWFAVLPRIGSADEATRDRWVVEAGLRAAARGVVGIVDLDPDDTHEAWRRRVAAGFDAHRVRASVWPQHLDAAIAAGLRTGDPVPGAGPLVTMGPLKVIADGSLNTRTAYCRHPYPDGDRGAMNVDRATLVEAMTRAREAGIEAAIHAIGDAALSTVLDAFEASGARGSVEHVQLATPSDLDRMARLGLAASVQPWHLVDDRDVAEVLWRGRTHDAYRFADMVRAGIELRLGSDAPVAPLDPWLAIRAAVLRTGDDRPAWHPEQRIGLDVALRSSVDGIERIAPGGPADLVLLDDDPTALDVARLPGIGVAATVCAGTVTHPR